LFDKQVAADQMHASAARETKSLSATGDSDPCEAFTLYEDFRQRVGASARLLETTAACIMSARSHAPHEACESSSELAIQTRSRRNNQSNRMPKDSMIIH
jgi:hypothetical protein